MSWTLDGKIRTHARLSNTSYMHLHPWTSVNLRRLNIGQFLSLHFKDRDEDFLSKGSKDILHDKKIYFHAPWNYQMYLLVSLWSLFCFLFSFRTNLWPHVVTKNTGKAVIHMANIDCLVTSLYEVFNRLEAFLFSFFSFLGMNEGIKRKHIFCTLW